LFANWRNDGKENLLQGITMTVQKADKGQFDEVLRRMLANQPQKTSEIKSPKKAPIRQKSAKRK
jgi:hypothetical protein